MTYVILQLPFELSLTFFKIREINVEKFSLQQLINKCLKAFKQSLWLDYVFQ